MFTGVVEIDEALDDGLETLAFERHQVLSGETVDGFRECGFGFVPAALGEEDFAEPGEGYEAWAEVGNPAFLSVDDGAEDLFGFGVVAAVKEHFSEVGGGLNGVGIDDPAGGTEAYVGIAEERFGAGRIVGSDGVGKHIHGGERVGMGRAERLALSGKGFLEQFDGLGGLADVGVGTGEMDEETHGTRMAWGIDFGAGGAIFQEEGESFLMIAALGEDGGQVVHGDEGIGVGDTVDAALDMEDAAVTILLLAKTADAVVDIAQANGGAKGVGVFFAENPAEGFDGGAAELFGISGSAAFDLGGGKADHDLEGQGIVGAESGGGERESLAEKGDAGIAFRDEATGVGEASEGENGVLIVRAEVLAVGGQELDVEGIGVGIAALDGDESSEEATAGEGVAVVFSLGDFSQGDGAFDLLLCGGEDGDAVVGIGDGFADGGFDEGLIGELAFDVFGGAVEGGADG